MCAMQQEGIFTKSFPYFFSSYKIFFVELKIVAQLIFLFLCVYTKQIRNVCMYISINYLYVPFLSFSTVYLCLRCALNVLHPNKFLNLECALIFFCLKCTDTVIQVISTLSDKTKVSHLRSQIHMVRFILVIYYFFLHLCQEEQIFVS